MLLVLISISLVSLCVGEDYQAWYIPEDKLARYPDHPKFKTNEDIFYGFTLKEPLFSAEEREEVCKRGCVCVCVGGREGAQWASTYPLLSPETPHLKTALVLPALNAFLPA